MLLFNRVLIASLAYLPIFSYAAIVTIEPDDYSSGTDLSVVSHYSSLSTTNSGAVYAIPVYPNRDASATRPPGVATTGPLGTQAFSNSSALNSEWEMLPSSDMDPYAPRLWADEQALMITFNVAVDYVSLLGGAVGDFGDLEFDDPVSWFIYDSDDRLLTYSYFDTFVSYLGSGDTGSGPKPMFALRQGNFRHPDIHRVIVAGESEFATLDRLVFNVVGSEVPERHLAR